MTFAVPEVVAGSRVQLADYPAGSTFGPRLLLDYEFVWVLRGSARWTVGIEQSGHQEQVSLRPGVLALARSGTIDSYHWDRDRTSTHAYVHFDLDDRGALPADANWPLLREFSAAPILEGLCGYLLELSLESSESARLRSDQLLGLLLDVFVTGPLPSAPALPDAVTAVIDRVRLIWQRDGVRIVAVEELAAAANISAGHLFRLFRQQYGCGPAKVLELVRLSQAAIALQRSNASLAEVAVQTGFANPYHLSRRFSSAYGISPGRFRARPVMADPLLPLRETGMLALVRALANT